MPISKPELVPADFRDRLRVLTSYYGSFTKSEFDQLAETGEVTQKYVGYDTKIRFYTLYPRTNWLRVGMWLTAAIAATATLAAFAGF